MHRELTNEYGLTDLNCSEHWEYLLVVQPDEEVNKKIIAEKEFFYDVFKEEMAIRTKPQITIAHFFAKEMMEETLIRWIQRICMLQKSFLVTLNNYSGFPAHAIYLRIQNPLPLQLFSNQLKMLNDFLESNNCPAIFLEPAPHLNIAQMLPENIYQKALLAYTEKSFHETFQVNKMMLYRQIPGNENSQLVNTFTLPGVATLFE